MKKVFLALGFVIYLSRVLEAQGVGINTNNPASSLSVSGNFSVGSGYAGTPAPTNGLIVQGIAGIGVPSGLTTAQLLVSSSSSARDGIRGTNSATSATGTYGALRGELSGAGHANAVGYVAYHVGSNRTFGIATQGGDYGGWFDRMVSIGASQPGTQNDLEVQNIASGIPATLILRQSSVNSTAGSFLGNLDFGDQRTLTGQARIQCIRGAPSSDPSDVPTDVAFFTTPDNSSLLHENLKLSHTGAVSFNQSFGISGQVLVSNGASSAPTWNDASSLSFGQMSVTKFGNNALTLSSDSTNYVSIPGLTDTLILSANANVFFSTEGTIELNLSGISDYAVARVAICADGIPVTVQRDVAVANTSGFVNMETNWSISNFATLGIGTHVIDVRVKIISKSAAAQTLVTLSGNMSSPRRAILTLFTLK